MIHWGPNNKHAAAALAAAYVCWEHCERRRYGLADDTAIEPFPDHIQTVSSSALTLHREYGL